MTNQNGVINQAGSVIESVWCIEVFWCVPGKLNVTLILGSFVARWPKPKPTSPKALPSLYYWIYQTTKNHSPNVLFTYPVSWIHTAVQPCLNSQHLIQKTENRRKPKTSRRVRLGSLTSNESHSTGIKLHIYVDDFKHCASCTIAGNITIMHVVRGFQTKKKVCQNQHNTKTDGWKPKNQSFWIKYTIQKIL